MAQITRSLIVDVVVTQVEMSQYLRLEKVLSDLTSTGLADFVVRQVKLCDCFVEHESLDEDGDQVIINQVSWEGKVHERGSGSKAVFESLCI